MCTNVYVNNFNVVTFERIASNRLWWHLYHYCYLIVIEVIHKFSFLTSKQRNINHETLDVINLLHYIGSATSEETKMKDLIIAKIFYSVFQSFVFKYLKIQSINYHLFRYVCQLIRQLTSNIHTMQILHICQYLQCLNSAVRGIQMIMLANCLIVTILKCISVYETRHSYT